MKTLGMRNLEKFLEKIVKHKLHNSLMIWGAPGIGKSSVVQSIADKNKLEKLSSKCIYLLQFFVVIFRLFFSILTFPFLPCKKSCAIHIFATDTNGKCNN